MFHNKDKFQPLDLVKLKLVVKHTFRSLLMLVKHDSCRLNSAESFLYTVSCNVAVVECIIFFIGKGIPPHKHANFFSFIISFALYIHRVHIQVSKRHFSIDG